MKNSSSPQVTVTTENDEGLQVLFDKLVDESDSLETDGLEFEGKTKPAGVAGSGIPEISNLFLV